MLYTEADFARHFLVNDARYLNLGRCPVASGERTIEGAPASTHQESESGERAAQIAVIAAEIDDDKQGWFAVLGQPTLVLGTRPTKHVND